MEETSSNSKKFNRVSQSSMPRHTLKEALVIANALRDDFAGSDATPLDLAQSAKRSPTSSSWRFLTGAAAAYGITDGAYRSPAISLTSLGRQIAMPTAENEETRGMIAAALTPDVPKAFYEKYDGNKFPSEVIAKNVLQQLGVPRDRTDEAYRIIIENGEFTGILKSIQGNVYVQLKGVKTNPAKSVPEIGDTNELANNDNEADEHEENEDTFSDPLVSDAAEEPVKTAPKPIFIAHGKDKEPLSQLTTILDQFKIPYKVAVNEPHNGRPVSQKVRDLMNECGSAIILFSTAEENKRAEDDSVIANLNVVFELGAASVLYGEKVIIFKEEGLALPSDFSGIAYISFEKDRLDAKAMELLKELISMGFVQVVTAG